MRGRSALIFKPSQSKCVFGLNGSCSLISGLLLLPSTSTPARLSYRQKLLFEGRLRPRTLCWRYKLLPDRCDAGVTQVCSGVSLSGVWRRKQLCWYKESYFPPVALIVVYLHCGHGAEASALHRALPQETKLNSCLTAARTSAETSLKYGYKHDWCLTHGWMFPRANQERDSLLLRSVTSTDASVAWDWMFCEDFRLDGPNSGPHTAEFTCVRLRVT